MLTPKKSFALSLVPGPVLKVLSTGTRCCLIRPSQGGSRTSQAGVPTLLSCFATCHSFILHAIDALTL